MASLNLILFGTPERVKGCGNGRGMRNTPYSTQSKIPGTDVGM